MTDERDAGQALEQAADAGAGAVARRSPRRQGSPIRLWQTELFIAVIVVAILILSGSIASGLKAILTEQAETTELRNASALAQRLEADFPLGVGGTQGIRQVITEYRRIYGDGIWVYDAEGGLLESAFDGAPIAAELESARLGALSDAATYVSSDIRANGWVVAAKPVHDDAGEVRAVVVSASSAGRAVSILQAVQRRMWVAFWVSLAVAGLLGFGFSELIGRRMRAMSVAAAAMAAGDFEQRLSTGFVPNELQDLATSYNRMAEKLGAAFASVEESRREIAAVVESMAEGVIAFDSAGTVRVINPEAARLLAVSAETAVGTPLEQLAEEPVVIEIVRDALAGRTGGQSVTLGQCVVALHASPLTDGGGEPEGAVLLLADITEANRIEAAQRRFVADASHEMRTPIAALKGMLELLVDGAKDVPEVRDDFINTMQFEVDRLGRLVSDLLTLAQLEAGSLKLRVGPEYAADLLGDVARVMQPLAGQAEVALSVEVADEDARVMADRDRIVQVLLSFTDNALKHSAAGTTIHLRAVPNGDALRLEVADEGAGIEPDELARVFERFYRVDAARASGSGTGLGLAIAKEVVEAHGSSIEVRSEPGAGSTFGFELQRA